MELKECFFGIKDYLGGDESFFWMVGWVDGEGNTGAEIYDNYMESAMGKVENDFGGFNSL